MSEDTVTNAEVDAAVDELAERAKSGIYVISGHAWNARARVDELARGLKRLLAEPERINAVHPIPGAYATDGETHWCANCKAEFAGEHPKNGCDGTIARPTP